MNISKVTVALVLSLLAFAACNDAATPTPTPTATPSPYVGYLAEQVEPCTAVAGSSVDPCVPGALPELPSAAASGRHLGEQLESIADALGPRPYSSGVLNPHMVVRGAYAPGTVRCTGPHTTRRAPFLEQPAYSGLETHCFADVQVYEYILGAGPSMVAVNVFSWMAFTEEGEQRKVVAALEEWIGRDFVGREMVLFLTPAFDYGIEAWNSTGWVIPFYDVQRLADGTVVAVSPERDLWRERKPDTFERYRTTHLEIPLPELRRQVADAHAKRVALFGGRIEADEALPMMVFDVHDLTAYMVSARAYEHPDGPPSKPPPVPGEGAPNPNIGVDDGTAAPTPTPPGG